MNTEAAIKLVTEPRAATQAFTLAYPPGSQRERLAQAFRARGVGVDQRTAYQRTKQWVRAAGGDWTRTLIYICCAAMP